MLAIWNRFILLDWRWYAKGIEIADWNCYVCWNYEIRSRVVCFIDETARMIDKFPCSMCQMTDAYGITRYCIYRCHNYRDIMKINETFVRMILRNEEITTKKILVKSLVLVCYFGNICLLSQTLDTWFFRCKWKIKIPQVSLFNRHELTLKLKFTKGVRGMKRGTFRNSKMSRDVGRYRRKVTRRRCNRMHSHGYIPPASDKCRAIET